MTQGAETKTPRTSRARKKKAFGSNAIPVSAEATALLMALRELAAIRATAEDAATNILESAEDLLARTGSGAAETAQEDIVSIMTACSFHDLVGQRVTKVTEILDRVLTAGLDDDAATLSQDAAAAKSALDIALDGPALPGSDTDQAAIDALFSEKS